MGDVAGTVEFGALTAIPETVQRNAFTSQGGGCQLFRNYGVSATDSGESGCLREAAELYGTFLGTFYFVNGVGNVFFLYKRLISGIEQNQSVVGKCVVHPFFQL